MINPHPARPAPPDGDVVSSADYELFWSLSFALTAATWRRIGGVCDRYYGYGAEDTDFAQTARAAGVPMRWVGAHMLFISSIPCRIPRLNICTTSCVTPRFSINGGAGGRCRTGWTRSSSADSIVRDSERRPTLL